MISTISSIYTCRTDWFCSGGGSQLRNDKKPWTLHTSYTRGWQCRGQEIPPTTSDKHISKASTDIQQTSISTVTYWWTSYCMKFGHTRTMHTLLS